MKYKRLSQYNHVDSTRHITVVKKTLSKNVGAHLHDFFEIEFVLEGEGENLMNGTVHPLRRGSIFLLTPADFHSISTVSEMKLITIMFDDSLLTLEMIDTLTSKRADIVLDLTDDDIATVVSIADMLIKESRTEDEYSLRSTKNLLEYLLMTLLRYGTSPTLGTKMLHPIDKALHYIYLHFREDPPLSAMASLAGYSPNYFSKLFSEHTGKTYSEYLNDLKTDLAKTMLTSSDRSSTEIAFSCGFSSISNFHRVFSQKCGMSPLEYRKNKNSVSL